MEEDDEIENSSSQHGVPKNVGYLITPTKKPTRRPPMRPVSQPPTFTPLNHRIEDRHLNDSDRETWFKDIARLNRYLDPEIQLSKLNLRLQQMALLDVYPNTQYLDRMVKSAEPEDQKVRSPNYGVDQSDI